MIYNIFVQKYIVFLKYKKVALVTHSFHKNTKSGEMYMNEIFHDKKSFSVDIYFNDEWKGSDEEHRFSEIIEGYDAVIILQIISNNLLKYIKDKNIIYMPMYDAFNDFNSSKTELWMSIAGLKIISTLEKTREILLNAGLSSYRIKYYPKVESYKIPNFKNVFFWNRVEKINYKTVLNLLDEYDFSNLNIHTVPDPGHNPMKPTEDEVKNFNITFTKWFDNKEFYNNEIEKYGIYIAARPLEGGAASFIDAMKRGKVVIAPNSSPYNEYIKHNVNGILYDIEYPSSINFDKIDLNKLSKNAFESVKKGRSEWENSLENLHSFIFDENQFINSEIYINNYLKIINNKWYKFGKLSKNKKIRFLLSEVFNIKINKKN